MTQIVDKFGTKIDVKDVIDMTGFAIPKYDYIALSYTGGNPTAAVYKSGGASGETVATLTMTYDGSNNLLTVTRS